jgi:ribosomal protein S18 acetylase RimI-like enzyme
MNCSELQFRTKTASCKSIREHLIMCEDSFNPALQTYVDIEKYGKKIFDNAVTFESWDGDVLVGLVAAYYNNNETKIGYIPNVSVLEQYQGHGFASQLLMTAIDFGRQRGFVRVDLELNIKNTKALRLYEQLGFVLSGRKNNDKVIMSCTLSPLPIQ